MNTPTGKDTDTKVQYQLLQLAQSMGVFSSAALILANASDVLKFVHLVRSFRDIHSRDIVKSLLFPQSREEWQELLTKLKVQHEKAVAASQAAESSCTEANKLVQIAEKKVREAEKVVSNYEEDISLHKEHLRQEEALRKKRDAVRSTVEVFDRGEDDYIATMNLLNKRAQSDKANAEYYEEQIEHTKQLRKEEYNPLKRPRRLYKKAVKTAKNSKNNAKEAELRLPAARENLCTAQSLQQQAVNACAGWSDELLRRQELCKMWYSLIAEMEKLYSVWSEWNITNGSDHTMSPSVIDQCDTVTAPVDSDSAAATATGGHSSSNACTVSEPPVERTRDWSESVDKNPTQGIPTVSA